MVRDAFEEKPYAEAISIKRVESSTGPGGRGGARGCRGFPLLREEDWAITIPPNYWRFPITRCLDE